MTRKEKADKPVAPVQLEGNRTFGYFMSKNFVRYLANTTKIKSRFPARMKTHSNLEELIGQMPIQEAANRMGISISILYKWCSGNAFPSGPNIWKIENFISSLLDREVSYREIFPNWEPDNFHGLE